MIDKQADSSIPQKTFILQGGIKKTFGQVMLLDN